MRSIILLLIIVGFVFLLSSSSCARNSSAANNCTAIRIGIPGLTLSHQNGAQCITCHTYQSIGPGCFAIAGSVYEDNKIDPYTSGEVRLYTLQNAQGQLRGTYYIDGRGNFYSTAKIEWGEGLFVSIYDANGNTKHMQGRTNDGNCNRCHGATDNRLVLP